MGFLAGLEGLLGLGAVVLAALAWRSAGIPGATAAAAAGERRRPLLALVVGTLGVLAVLTVPLFHGLLASWIPRWPGVMCLAGVRRIGTGTLGASRRLPELAAGLDVTTVAVVFLVGAWVLLHRGTGRTLGRWAAVAALLAGLVGLLDGAGRITYVAIQREEVLPAAGCCTAMMAGSARASVLQPATPGGDGGLPFLAFTAVSAALGAGALALGRRKTVGALGVLAALATAALPFGARVLVDVLSPALLRLPIHRCAWCAFARAPETLVAAAAFLVAVLCAAWAPIAHAAAGDDGAGDAAGRLLVVAAFGFLASAGFVLTAGMLP